jgi:cytosine/adenosine deaminase-related metal-dependent hydrolase
MAVRFDMRMDEKLLDVEKSSITSNVQPNLHTVQYTHCTIIAINSSRDIILDGALLVTGSRIAPVGKTAILSYEISTDTGIVNLEGKIIIPGLINAHSHLAQSLLRGLAEDLPLHSWLCDAIWPLEASYVTDDGYVEKWDDLLPGEYVDL